MSSSPPAFAINPIDDLTFLVACKMTETMLADSSKLLSSSSNQPTPLNSSNSSTPLTSTTTTANNATTTTATTTTTTEHFVKTLQTLAMQLRVPWEHLQQRLAWEHVRQYCSGANVPSTRHHMYLLIRRHCPDELCHLPDRVAGLSATQLLDVLVLLDEAFGGSAQAASCVGDGFREVLLRNSVLERENAELAMQLRTIRDKPKAQQNEAAFLVAELQQKLYEALGTMQTMMSNVAAAAKVERRNVASQSENNDSNKNNSNNSFEHQQQQQSQSQSQSQKSNNNNNNNNIILNEQQQQNILPVVVTATKCDHPKLIAELQQKLNESLQREVLAKQDMLSRVSQFSELTTSMSAKQLTEKNSLVGCKHISIQTEPDAQLTRLAKERGLLLERLSAATELLKSSTSTVGGGGGASSLSVNNSSFSSRRH